jgi:flagellar protein FliS
MGPQAQARKYFEQRVLTAPREDLLLMLLDGAARFAEAGRRAMEERRYDESCSSLIRAQRIMMELMTALRKDMLDEELYGRLMGLYFFVYRRFVDANLQRDPALIGEGMRILDELRSMWREAVAKFKQEKAAGAGEERTGWSFVQ